jgi:hypothetical protein
MPPGSFRELSRQISHQMLLQPSPNNWPCLQMKPGTNRQPPLLGTSQIPAELPLMMSPTQHEAARLISAHNTNKRLEC